MSVNERDKTMTVGYGTLQSLRAKKVAVASVPAYFYFLVNHAKAVQNLKIVNGMLRLC